MTLKFNGFKAKTNFHTILNFVLFQKYEMYENKYRTKLCDFTVPVACSIPYEIDGAGETNTTGVNMILSQVWKAENSDAQHRK